MGATGGAQPFEVFLRRLTFLAEALCRPEERDETDDIAFLVSEFATQRIATVERAKPIPAEV